MSRGHRPLRHPAMSMRYRPELVHFTAVRQNTYLPRCRSRDLRSQLTMYITDVRHFLDEKGAVGPQRGPDDAIYWSWPRCKAVGRIALARHAVGPE